MGQCLKEQQDVGNRPRQRRHRDGLLDGALRHKNRQSRDGRDQQFQTKVDVERQVSVQQVRLHERGEYSDDEQREKPPAVFLVRPFHIFDPRRQNETGNHVQERRHKYREREDRKRPICVVRETEIGPPHQEHDQQEIDHPNYARPIKYDARTVDDQADDRTQQMRDAKSEYDRNENREVRKDFQRLTHLLGTAGTRMWYKRNRLCVRGWFCAP